MASIIGNAIVIIALVVALFFAGRSTLRQFKRELSGGGCAGCGGSCSGCSGCSASSQAKGCSCNAGSGAAGK